MIKINLASKKQAAYVTGEKKQNLNIDIEAIKEYPIGRISMTLVVILAGNIIFGNYKEAEIAKLREKVNKIRLEERKLTRELARKKNLEETKKSLEADEFTMRTKIETINQLMLGRNRSSSMLLALSELMPSDLWFTEFSVAEQSVTLKGVSVNYNLISDLMRKLGESVYFADVTLRSTEQRKDKSGIEVADFEIVARKRQEPRS